MAGNTLSNYAGRAHSAEALLTDPQEEWRISSLPIKNGHLEVSNTGRARLVITIPTIGRLVHGYRKLCIKPHREQFLHRLIADAFLGVRPESHVVNHIDADKLNNRAENLEYVTPLENVHHAMKLGRLRNGAEKKRLFDAEQIRVMRDRYRRGVGMRSLARIYGVTVGTIGQIVRRETYREIE